MTRIALRASGVWFVSAENGGGGKVSARANSVTASERFSVLPEVGESGATGRVYLRASNGQYVCAEGGGGGAVNANRDAANIWETFERVGVGDKVAFKTHDGHYLRAPGGGGGELLTDATAPTGESTFFVETQPYIWKDLEITFTDSFRQLWTDKGSGAEKDGSFWRPVPPVGFFSLGDLCVEGYGNPSGKRLIAVVRDLSGTALREPTEFRRIWGDWGSGADQDGSMWEPVAPDGYVALGCVANTGYDPPAKGEVRCVRQDLVTRGATSKEPVWTDRGSGADSDFSAWTATVLPGSPGEIMLSPGTFVGGQGYNPPDGSPCLNGLRLGVQEAPPRRRPAPLAKLELAPGAMPAEFGPDVVHYTTYLPWFAVRDPSMSDGERLRDCPVYRLEREDRYHLHSIVDNRGNKTKQSETFKYTTGFSREEAKSFSEKTRIEVGLRTKFTGGTKDVGGASLEVSVTMTESLTFGWSWTDTTSTSETKTFTLNAESGTLVAAYLVKSVVRLFRTDGSMVGSPIDGTGPDKIVYYEAV